ncbi:tRNA lysidine(34) synthetase TilS [Pengzhenrongella sicca]|uniref:tRNA(Ile)-lysidine synthase n=1 Tax=Pengzhenrongella sicca TaxID=2819238 RepID=A0A8A4ZCZ8_9MICO|nr:tRNA lysidine(34) synthetase TilS [Pengzhenrongella sicca]QTE29784.1 tRNA lysidine(34) synthetase TilS [Pengzhenrongella sicca]
MTGPPPAVAAARVAVRADLADLPPGALVLVACSGGPDSLALAATTAFVSARAGLRAGAVVVDHGLQAGSADVARDAARACRDLGLDPVRVVAVEVGGGGGPEAAARSARYTALEAAATELGAAAVLLGHTLDDQAETVLLALARGSGARSLAGMPARRGSLRRPLLGLRREQTLAVCAALGLAPWHDPTNGGPCAPVAPAAASAQTAAAGPAQRRREVRHRVLPLLEDVLGPGVALALARTGDQLREDAEALEALAATLLAAAEAAAAETTAAGPAGADPAGAGLDVDLLAAAPAAVRRRALRLAAIGAGCPPGALHRAHVLAMDALVTAWHGQAGVDLPGRIALARACGRLTFHNPQY